MKKYGISRKAILSVLTVQIPPLDASQLCQVKLRNHILQELEFLGDKNFRGPKAISIKKNLLDVKVGQNVS